MMPNPTVTIMCATTLDGKLAPGENKSSAAFAEEIPKHFTDQLYELREKVDAIVVGSGTIESDDPSLQPRSHDDLKRVVLDSSGGTNPDAKVLSDSSPTIVATAQQIPDSFVEQVEKRANKEAVHLGDERVDPNEVLNLLEKRGANRIMLEGGGRVIHSFLTAELIDQIRVLYLPVISGAEGAPSLATGASSLFADVRVSVTRREQLGDYTFLVGDVEYE